MDERLKRIAEMEERLNRIKEWLKDETLDSVEDDVRVLDAYYRSPLWRISKLMRPESFHLTCREGFFLRILCIALWQNMKTGRNQSIMHVMENLSGSGIDGERQSPASGIHYRSAIACMSMTVRKKVFRSGCV